MTEKEEMGIKEHFEMLQAINPASCAQFVEVLKYFAEGCDDYRAMYEKYAALVAELNVSNEVTIEVQDD